MKKREKFEKDSKVAAFKKPRETRVYFDDDEFCATDSSDTLYDLDHHLDPEEDEDPFAAEARYRNRKLSTMQAIELALDNLALRRALEDYPDKHLTH